MLCRFIHPLSDVDFLLEINASEETIEELLNEYRKENKQYDRVGWLQFLHSKGIEAGMAKYSLFDF